MENPKLDKSSIGHEHQVAPVDQQYALANSILESLIQKGRLPMSDTTLAELDLRVAAFDTDPNSGESWENVRQELFVE